MKRSAIFILERKDWLVITILLIALALLVSAHLFAIRILNEYESSTQAVEESFEGDGLLRNLDRNLVETESAVRSFVLLEDEKYAASTEETIKNVKQDIVTIRRFFRESSQEDNLVRLEELVDEKIRFNKNVIDNCRQQGNFAAGQMLGSGLGLALRDSISALTGSLRERHRQHLENYLAQKADTSRRLRSISWLSVLAVLLLTPFSVYYLSRSARRRQKAVLEKEQKQLELEQHLVLIKKAKLEAERAGMLKEQFIANMSHEIRTPLNAILGFSNLLQRTGLSPNQKEFADNIQMSSENLLAIINDILDFSRIEAGALRLERIPFSLPGLLHSVDNMFRYRAKEKNLQFEVQADDTLPEAVLGDPTRLTQILVNLLGNAFKFTSQGGVKLRVSEANREGANTTVRFTVQDTGIGIPPDKQEAIFDRFGQAASDTTRRFGGAGLGLSISKQLAELQGGRITVESGEGKGAAFTVEIPYAIAGALAGNGGNPQPQPGNFKNRKVNILIVEDNPMNLRIAELLLEGWGFRYDHAENGRAALELLRKKAYDLVLMDIQMPEMDGYTAARKIRQELRLDVPIIATTAHAFAGEREKCISYGMNDYISKPIKEDELFSLIVRYAPQGRPNKGKPVPTQPADDAPEGFDRQYILDISKGKPEVLREMAALFATQSAKELELMEKALQSNNFGEAAVAAHSMKSTAAYMGFAHSLGEVLKKLELEARSSSPDGAALQALLEQVKKMREEAAVFLEGEFSGGDDNG